MGFADKQYAIVTLHRPSNVDQQETLDPIVQALKDLSTHLQVAFPIHPRTRSSFERFGLMNQLTSTPGIHCVAPLNYVRFMNLIFNCRLVITDSGGIQEETTYLGIPCITLRENTERPVTVTKGTNRLCNVHNMDEAIEAALSPKSIKLSPPDMWDGKTAHRVANSIFEFLK